MTQFKSRRSLRKSLLLGILLLSAIISSFAFFQAYQQTKMERGLVSLQAATAICDHLFNALEKISIEREVTFSILEAGDPEIKATLLVNMQDARRDADTALNLINADFADNKYEDLKKPLQTLTLAKNALSEQRAIADLELKKNESGDSARANAWFHTATGLTTSIFDVWTGLMRHYVEEDSISVLEMRLKHLLGTIMEFNGRERTVIGGLIVGARPATVEEQANLLRWQGMAEMSWRLSETVCALTGLDQTILPYLKEARSHYANGYNMVKELFYIPGAKMNPPYPISINVWLELSLEQIESLHDLKTSVLSETQLHGQMLIREARNLIFIATAVAAIALLLCAAIFIFVDRGIIYPIRHIVEDLRAVVAGKEVLSPPAQGSTYREIETLVGVLEAFQKKNEETRLVSIELEKRSAKLERSNAELDKFAYVASHDLKAPLRGIDTLASWIEEDSGDALPAVARDHLKMLRKRVARLEDLLAGILSYSRAGRIVEPFTEINSQELVRTIGDMWVRKQYEVVIGNLPVIRAPKTAWEQIIGNLLSNAAKHHDKPEGRIEVNAFDEGDFWRYEVSDDGPGIPPEYREKVFEMFRTLRPRDKVEGTGLGMAIAKKLLESVGGKIWVKDQSGIRGTTICFLWPKVWQES